MKVELKIPNVGESVSEGILNNWLVSNGDYVSEGQPVFELETDKTSMDVSSPAEGTLRIQVEAGKDVLVGETVGEIDTDGKMPTKSKSADEIGGGAGRDVAGDSAGIQKAEEQATESQRITPAARVAISKSDVDSADIKGSGRSSMITREDVLKVSSGERKPTGAFPEETTIPSREIDGEAGGAGKQNDQSKTETTRKPLTRIRRLIASNLARTRDELVLLTTFNEADMSSIKRLRTEYGKTFMERHDVKLGFMSFFLKASAAGLKAFPEINAYIEGDDVVYHGQANIGVAVSTSRGLITPVIRHVESMGFAEVEKSIIRFARSAENKTLLPDNLTGGSFTVTNGGIFGSMMSTPLPAPKQSAILGMHAIIDRPVAIEGRIEVRPMMYLALSYDHRLIDGREAVGFLKTVKEAVENPERILLDV